MQIEQFMHEYAEPIAIVVVVAQTLARAIPDDRKGVWGIIRGLAKIIGFYRTPDLSRVERRVGDAIATADNANARSVTAYTTSLQAKAAAERKKPPFGKPPTPEDAG